MIWNEVTRCAWLVLGFVTWIVCAFAMLVAFVLVWALAATAWDSIVRRCTGLTRLQRLSVEQLRDLESTRAAHVRIADELLAEVYRELKARGVTSDEM